jgi:transposase
MLNVHIYGGISRRGPSYFTLFTGILKKEFLVEVLYPNQIAWLRRTFGEDHRFIQDNDPKHNSKFALDFLKMNKIHVTPFPASSPDLNPIGVFCRFIKCVLF